VASLPEYHRVSTRQGYRGDETGYCMTMDYTEQDQHLCVCVELGTCCDLVNYQQLLQKTHGWWEASQWSLSYNQVDWYLSDYQPGGTGLVVVNQLAHHAQKSGDDPSGLGQQS